MFKPVLAFALLVFSNSVLAQNFSINYKNPDQLVVCSDDTLSVTVQNNTASLVSGALLELELPGGLTYLPGSVIGAQESDISNLGNPILALPDLQPGIPVTIRVRLEAGCGLVEAINSGQLFSALIQVHHGATTESLETTKFQIQTSLVVITQVDDSPISGEKGDVLMRTIHVRNTRLGPIRHLFLQDNHPEGISIHIDGAVSEQDQPTSYSAYFDGAFFTQFGDGDTLLEFGETALIKQQITITDCGIPSYVCRSNIIAEWSCTAVAPPCQGDSTLADVTILPSTYEPRLTFQTEFALPWDHCAQLPHEMRFRVINTGEAPATNVIFQLNSEGPGGLGMDKNSFKISRNGGPTGPMTPNLTEDVLMEDCGVTSAAFVTLFLPEVQSQDTLDISFDALYCRPVCKQLLPKIRLNYFYNKPCPEGGFAVADTVVFTAKLEDYLSAGVIFNIGECLDDGQTYPFFYRLHSSRLLSDTGYIFLKLDLPVGLDWSPDCPPLLSGQAPEVFSITPTVTTFPVNRVLAGFKLPLADTSAVFSFCLKNNCTEDGSYVWIDADVPDSGDEFTVFVPGACYGCGYKPDVAALLSLDPDIDLDCAVQACESFELQTTCDCPTSFVPPNPPDTIPVGPDSLQGCTFLRDYFQATRLNYDLPDNDDDRKPDASGQIDLDRVRRDRFLPGDTIRNLLATKVVCGDSIRSMFYQLFAEVIASDYGYAGVNDTFPIGPFQTNPARYGFTDTSKVKIIEAELTIWDASAGAVYSCPWTPEFVRDKLYGEVAFVNTKPAAVIDEMATMNYPFNPTMQALANAGCVPPGFTLATGDSVQLRVDLKFNMNYAPFSKDHWPPLVNFEMGYNANKLYQWYNYRTYDTLMFQYSGYRDSLNSATFGIRPCDNSIQITPFAYNIRIARENLFPYEVRPLSQLINYDLIMPPGLTPLSAELLFLNLQENTPVLQNLPLPFTVVPDSMVHVDFSPTYQVPIDEGYAIRSLLTFEPSCTFTEPDSSAQWIQLDFPGCMSMPDTVQYILENKIGFYSNHPRDTMTSLEAVYDFSTDQVLADVVLRNKAPITAPNFWIQLINPENGLANLTLSDLASGTVYSPQNGLYQLGPLGILAKKDLRIRGVNTSCDPQRLLILYGWDCQPYLTPGAPSCGAVDTLELLFRPRNPEIELELVSSPVNVPLCDTSDYFVLELSNADLGYAYKPFVNLELPAGLQLLPGSCQVSYPAGSVYQPIPDPVAVGGNLLEWNLSSLLDSIAKNGLPGVNLDPKNALRIRFKIAAACGAISNAQMIFGAKAEWYCGRPTNTLRKASDPILIEGLTPGFEAQINLMAQASGGQGACGLDRKINASILVSGAGLPGDSIYVRLPAGFVYKSNSYAPGANAPLGEPQVAGKTLRWPLPAALPANTLISFSFVIEPQAPLNCDNPVLSLETRQQVSAFCPAINADCQVYVVNGAASIALPEPPSGVDLSAAVLMINSDGTANYVVTVTNPGSQPLEIDYVQFFYDTDLNGHYSPTDVLLYTVGDLNILVAPGASVDIPVDGLPAPDSLCNLIAVIPGLDNCFCQTAEIAVVNSSVEHASSLLCPGESVPLGVTELSGHIYSWDSGVSLPCTNCSEFQFIPPGPGQYTMTLTDQGPGCSVLHNYTVEVRNAPELQTGNSMLCRGKSFTLQTSTAVNWNWQGPGIVNPSAPTQTISASQSAWYYVTATNTEGCMLTDSVFITVLPADTTDLGILRTCEGTPVEIFGNMTETPGLYTQTLSNIAGCDSLIYLNLEVVPNTEEILQRCPPGAVLVFGEEITDAGSYCRSFTSSLGCDSMHCITVMDLPVPELPDPDTFYFVLGGSVVLPGPDGYMSYLWSPADSLSCTTCQSPVANPIDTMEYQLVLVTADSCLDTLIYRVVPYPPCDPARILIPNAFTPDGDGVNDVFSALPYEGSEVISHLIIYNRWGQKVYEASGPNAAWDGTTFGEPAPSDVYVWLLEVLCDGERKIRKGDVTVLR